jgi:hypothetical protein
MMEVYEKTLLRQRMILVWEALKILPQGTDLRTSASWPLPFKVMLIEAQFR